MKSIAVYVAAAIAEIAGCYAIWAVVRLDASRLWLLPAVAALVTFGWLLTRVDVDAAGRAYAVYGGIYIASSLAWMWIVERQAPDRWDTIGSAIAIAGAFVILFAPRSA